MKLVALCYKIAAFGQTVISNATHTRMERVPFGGTVARPESTSEVPWPVKDLTAAFTDAALTMGPYVRALLENQIDRLHVGRERKAITYSGLYFFSRLDQYRSYCKAEKMKVKF